MLLQYNDDILFELHNRNTFAWCSGDIRMDFDVLDNQQRPCAIRSTTIASDISRLFLLLDVGNEPSTILDSSTLYFNNADRCCGK